MTSDGLLNYRRVAGPKGSELVPDLAEAIPAATDGGKTYAFKVRKGIKYSTGAEVKPSDFTYTMERQFKAAAPGLGLLPGPDRRRRVREEAQAAATSPRAWSPTTPPTTVTFHLTEPDPDFLQKLAIPFAYVVPKGTPNKDIGTKPLPATGPYKIDASTTRPADGLRAQPELQGVVARGPARRLSRQDRDEARALASDAVTQIEHGQADWSYDAPPADRLGEIGDKYKDQFHINPVPQIYHMAINTRVAPFDNVEVRQALNLATDRNAVLSCAAARRSAASTCQVLPFGLPGPRGYCPYTEEPGREVVGARHGKGQAARRPVRHQGAEGHPHLDPGRDDEGRSTCTSSRCSPSSATRRHQDAELVRAVLVRAGLAQQGAALVLLLVPRLHVGVELHDDRGRLRRLPPRRARRARTCRSSATRRSRRRPRRR